MLAAVWQQSIILINIDDLENIKDVIWSSYPPRDIVVYREVSRVIPCVQWSVSTQAVQVRDKWKPNPVWLPVITSVCSNGV